MSRNFGDIRVFVDGTLAPMTQSWISFGPERVLSGPGAVARLAEQVRSLGTRALLMTTRSLHQRSRASQAIAERLGDLLVGVYPECSQHSPGDTVRDATAAAREARADVLVSFGGGSVIDTAKAVALELAGASGPPPPQLALPTTLSAAEFTPVAGITDEGTRVKGLRIHPRLVPRVVILDPQLTAETLRGLAG